MDPTQIAEKTRQALQLAMHDARVRKIEADPKLAEHLEDAQRQLEEARAAFDAGPAQIEDPIEAKARELLEAEVQRTEVAAKLQELRIADPRIDTTAIEAVKADGGQDQ